MNLKKKIRVALRRNMLLVTLAHLLLAVLLGCICPAQSALLAMRGVVHPPQPRRPDASGRTAGRPVAPVCDRSPPTLRRRPVLPGSRSFPPVGRRISGPE